jgi:hypothetical protein
MVEATTSSRTDVAPVQFGIFDWIDRNQLPLPDLYEERLHCLEYADEAGFYCYHLAEHQATPLSLAPSPSVFLAAAMQRTHRLRLGPLVYLLPLYNPLRLVQEICMLDNMSRGRLEVGIGRGVSPFELAFYKVTPQQARTMFREALDILIAGLRTGEVSYRGEHYSFTEEQQEPAEVTHEELAQRHALGERLGGVCQRHHQMAQYEKALRKASCLCRKSTSHPKSKSTLMKYYRVWLDWRPKS